MLYPLQVAQRVAGFTFITNFEVEMGACRVTGAAHQGNVLALEDLLSLLQKYLDNERYELIPSKNYKDCLELDEKPWDIPDDGTDELPL